MWPFSSRKEAQALRDGLHDLQERMHTVERAQRELDMDMDDLTQRVRRFTGRKVKQEAIDNKQEEQTEQDVDAINTLIKEGRWLSR